MTNARALYLSVLSARSLYLSAASTSPSSAYRNARFVDARAFTRGSFFSNSCKWHHQHNPPPSVASEHIMRGPSQVNRYATEIETSTITLPAQSRSTINRFVVGGMGATCVNGQWKLAGWHAFTSHAASDTPMLTLSRHPQPCTPYLEHIDSCLKLLVSQELGCLSQLHFIGQPDMALCAQLLCTPAHPRADQSVEAGCVRDHRRMHIYLQVLYCLHERMVACLFSARQRVMPYCAVDHMQHLGRLQLPLPGGKGQQRHVTSHTACPPSC